MDKKYLIFASFTLIVIINNYAAYQNETVIFKAELVSAKKTIIENNDSIAGTATKIQQKI